MVRLMIISVIMCLQVFTQPNPYIWTERYDSSLAIINRIPLPDSYTRITIKECSFGHWLSGLPLKKGKPPVYLYNGQKRENQDVHYAVFELDVGDEDLQQCADVIIRLRAEYLYYRGCYDSIQFQITNGDTIRFRKWIIGYRPVVRDNALSWAKSAKADSSYKVFREYLNFLFKYAGTYSLSRELQEVDDLSKVKIGDIIIQGGFPGHAIIIVGMAVDQNKKKVVLLAQSFMPAQDFYILRNPNSAEIDPWYEIDFGDKLITPEWIFNRGDIKRF